MTRKILIIFGLICCTGWISGKPMVVKSSTTKKPTSSTLDPEIEDLAYAHYLDEVMNALEEDKDFKEVMGRVRDIEDVKSGGIAIHLAVVDHKVRTKLDEIKRREIQRLKELATDYYELTNDIDREHMKIDDHDHIDHKNAHTFEVEDLRRLIKTTAKHLDELDERRHQEFKNYELEKEYQKHEKLEKMNDTEKQIFQKELVDQEKKHKNHPKLHHPGSKQQLKEVWEEQVRFLEFKKPYTILNNFFTGPHEGQ